MTVMMISSTCAGSLSPRLLSADYMHRSVANTIVRQTNSLKTTRQIFLHGYSESKTWPPSCSIGVIRKLYSWNSGREKDQKSHRQMGSASSSSAEKPLGDLPGVGKPTICNSRPRLASLVPWLAKLAIGHTPRGLEGKMDYSGISDDEWKKRLTKNQYEIARKKGTERAFTGEYWNTKIDGIYHCVCCDTPLFESNTKFDSGTGWPSYYDPIRNNVKSKVDFSIILMPRQEVLCETCDAHLGHVFDDGPPPTGKRYCINSASLKLKPRKE